MPQKGGTKPKPVGELASAFALHMRRSPAVQKARASYLEKKDGRPQRAAPVPVAPPPAPVHVPVPAPKPKSAAMPSWANVPSHLRPWLHHLWQFEQAHPALSKKEAMQEARKTWKGSYSVPDLAAHYV